MKSKVIQDSPGRPFVKWVGGKEKLRPTLARYMPLVFDRYFEPFLGGGAMALGILASRSDVRAYLSDSNVGLIECWEMVRDNPGQFIHQAHRLVNSFILADDKSKWYYALREQPKPEIKAERAARFLALNKTCYNGLYRENESGRFNVPFGKYKRLPEFYSVDNILACSKVLQGAIIEHCNYNKHYILGNHSPGDFYYLDPPYLGNFANYQSGGFQLSDHIHLKNFCDELTRAGVKFMLSNSYKPETVALYSDYRQYQVTAPRSVSCKGNDRQSVIELLVTNYDVEVFANGPDRV